MRSFTRYIEDAYREIRSRQAEAGKLSFVEFENEEYNILLSIAKEIVHCFNNWPTWKREKARVVFLTFACEYVKRNKYIDDIKFWAGFEEELGIGNEYYSLIAEELLWETYADEKIEQKWSSGNRRRLFVWSLISEVNASEATRQELLNFFIWYYRNVTIGDITNKLINLYEASSKRQLGLPEKAIAALSKDCQILSHCITYAIEQNISLTQTDFESYNREIMAELGPHYDLTRIQLLRSRKKLYDLILQLENHCMPTQFLSILERQSKAPVQTPGGTQLTSYTALKSWKTRDFPYGRYLLDRITYRVVPAPWLSLEIIAQWPYEQVISLRQGGYIGYKKREQFHVQIGKRSVEGRLCILENERCYIWTDAVPHGELLVIDRQIYRESAGIDWKISLCLCFNEYHQPAFEIICDTLKAYFPEKPRGCITIRTSQGYEKSVYLKSDGICHFSRAITFPLKNFVEPVTISLYLDKGLLDCKQFDPEMAYLFSYQTHERIKVGTKRESGEKHYYLFTASKNDITAQGIELESLDATFGPYFIYEITWQQSDQPMQLQLGDLSWAFQSQRYFFIQVQPQPITEFIQLARHQVQQISHSTLVIISNMNVMNPSVICQVFFSDELIYEETTGKCLYPAPSQQNQYLFTQAFFEMLNERTVGQQHYGHCTILFFEEGRLLGETTLALIPTLEIQATCLRQPVLENEEMKVYVSSSSLSIWDPKEGKAGSVACLSMRPGLTFQPTNQPGLKGVTFLASQVIGAPVTFPTIGETIEIKVCPDVFGFRLYGKKADQYQRVDILNYYMVDTAYLYVFTVANYKVSIYVDGNEILSQNANPQGDAIFPLTKLKYVCQSERTEVIVVSAGLKSTFFIRWTPLIHELNVKEDRIHLDMTGPKSTGVTLRLVDSNNQIFNQQNINCRGERFETEIDLPLIQSDWGQFYLTAVYFLTDGTEVPSVWQWRINLSRKTKIPLDWLLNGVGISSETLLQAIIVE